ncbi:acetyl-CoA carboxylase biotin carboxylase subunit family protein [Burkholderia sp. Se-20378]|uniref:ATP-grasp domain-containing protein n=1 Tax=Burkholderia sp. Se-20378 TaxID=2703899 RepID=UPI00197F33D6|nr:ATP-grasp domain-containing protein [Burkholderia sp. Se-20378]MBN3769423.1 ATP-grasp domain-containing protein [Burkholderia sp. Se-20378]
MTARSASTLLIVDYNLSRVEDVAHLARHARERYGARTVLIRSGPSERDRRICDDVIDLDPLADGFVDAAVAQLAGIAGDLRAGIVFSDNAVQQGAALLERLGLAVDSASLAAGAFSKHAYRVAEHRVRALLEAQRVMVPDYAEVASVDDLRRFAAAHPGGFVVKPSCEGNNRGVVVVRNGDSLEAAFGEVAPYLAGGVICEAFIPFAREFSFDGLGALAFTTEKVSATGRYPVEVAQILPSRLADHEADTLTRAGRLANLLVGQRAGPFHNEIKLSDDGLQAAVVEPNRRPAGMKIWWLARWAYGVDLFHAWIDTVWGVAPPVTLPAPARFAAAVMLGVAYDRQFSPQDVRAGADPLGDAIADTVRTLGLRDGALQSQGFEWLHAERRFVHAIARDNADFVALACITLEPGDVDIRDVVATLRASWPVALDAACEVRAAA